MHLYNTYDKKYAYRFKALLMNACTLYKILNQLIVTSPERFDLRKLRKEML